jgi:DNA-directed RNA polymerase specialized sigma24 family protein
MPVIDQPAVSELYILSQPARVFEQPENEEAMITQQSETLPRYATSPASAMGRSRARRDVVSNPGDLNLSDMDLAVLVSRCATESERFYRGQQHDTRYSYELFRRSLVEGDQAAWEQLYQHYSGLVEGWIRRSGAFVSSGESSEYFVVGAFTKFWRAISPERFASFPTLASLLQYLQLCATSVVIDSVRAQSWSEVVPEEAITPNHDPQTSPDEEAVSRVDREEFWQFIDGQLHNEIERVVVYCSFVLGLTPRAIYAKRSELFSSVNDVYNVKRNVLGRLSRNTQLRQFMSE